MRWEYAVETVSWVTLQAMLDLRGDAGWELVAADLTDQSAVTAIFKRPAPWRSEREMG
jgi:hypothetical protein